MTSYISSACRFSKLKTKLKSSFVLVSVRAATQMGPTAACHLTKSRRSISRRCRGPCRAKGSRAKPGTRRSISSSLSSASPSISPTYGASPTIVSTCLSYSPSADVIQSFKLQLCLSLFLSRLYQNNDVESGTLSTLPGYKNGGGKIFLFAK